MKTSLYSLSFEALQQAIIALGEPKFRAKQVWDFLITKRIKDFNDMHNLPASLKEKLKSHYTLFDMKIVHVQGSEESATKKYLLSLKDGHQVEAVLMTYEHGTSVCISTQVGCRMGCTFCASTIDGLARNLEAYELWEQIAILQADAKLRISHVVLMGSGEPLDNYENVIKFIRTVTHDDHFNIGQRHIAVSTCGLVNKIDRLADEKLQVTLAISLHNPFNDARSSLVPVNKKWPVEELIASVDRYIAKTNRRVTIEYTLIKDVNDQQAHSDALIKLLRGKLIHVNLIPVNPIAERDYQPTDKKHVQQFKARLEKGGLNVTVRRELGDDIDAACGQLRRSFERT
jgi:23S rRNA (adenine2503-C2)-methyltransferase